MDIVFLIVVLLAVFAVAVALALALLVLWFAYIVWVATQEEYEI